MEPIEEVPALTADIVADDDLLAEWADGVIRGDAVAQARAAEIDQWREWLQDACEPDIWKLVLEVDARVTERWDGLASVLVRYGLEAGRRLPLKSGEVDR